MFENQIADKRVDRLSVYFFIFSLGFSLIVFLFSQFNVFAQDAPTLEFVSGKQSTYSESEVVIKVSATGFETVPSALTYFFYKQDESGAWNRVQYYVSATLQGNVSGGTVYSGIFRPARLPVPSSGHYRIEAVPASNTTTITKTSFEFDVRTTVLADCTASDCLTWTTCQFYNNVTQQKCLNFANTCRQNLNLPITRTCQLACQSITCQTWSGICVEGQEVCTVFDKTPAGCVGEPDPAIVKRNCQVAPLCNAKDLESSCGDWSVCRDGMQKRSCVTPDYCRLSSEIVLPLSYKSCTVDAIPCSYSYGPWSSCQSNGSDDNKTYRTRLYTKEPANCVGEPALELYQQSCESQCTDFNFSEWSSCLDGHQTRKVINKIPSTCSSEPSTYDLIRKCQTTPTLKCQVSDWYCSVWSECLDSVRTRKCQLTNTKCQYPDVVMPKEIESCVVKDIIKKTIKCDEKLYKVDCGDIPCVQGQRQGCKVVAKYPVGCEGSDRLDVACREELTDLKNNECQNAWACSWSDCVDGVRKQSCQQVACLDKKLTAPIVKEEPCQVVNNENIKKCREEAYLCSSWSSCVGEGSAKQRIRSCQLKPECAGLLLDRPALTEACPTEAIELVDVPSAKFEQPIDSEQEILMTEQTKQASDKAGEDLRQAITEVVVGTSLPSKCVRQNITDPNQCDIFLRTEAMPSICSAQGAKTKAECKALMERDFEAPKQCLNLTALECSRLINNVVLSGYINPVDYQAVKNEIEPLASSVISLSDKAGRLTVDTTVVGTPRGLSSSIAVTVANPELLKTALPIKVSEKIDNLLLLKSNTSVDNQNSNTLPAVLMLDDDRDGLPNDTELRLGTDSKNADTDSDGYNDFTEVKMGYNPIGSDIMTSELKNKLSALDWVILNQGQVDQPKARTELADDKLVVQTVTHANVSTSNYQISGKAEPNTEITIYIYSQMPLVLTTKTDVNGNWVYELDRPLADGKHEVYVAINDDAGNIQASSNPLAFFVKEAKAVSMEEYIDEAVTPLDSQDSSSKMLVFYIIAGSTIVMAALLLFYSVRKMIYK